MIGYKLFDGTREELLSAARHTLEDSKANIIFANTPSEAKSKKIAVTQSGAEIEMDFDQHTEFIRNAINDKWYRTEIKKTDNSKFLPEVFEDIEDVFAPVTLRNPFWAKKAIELFMSENKHGSFAVKQDTGFIISGRGHKHVSKVYDVDHNDFVITADEKASANAPLVSKMIKNFDIVLHKHEYLPNLKEFEYCFPGTERETDLCMAGNEFNIKNHGYMKSYFLEKIDWEKYYEVFPEKYFKIPDFILKEVENCSEILEIGCNSRPLEKTKYVIEKDFFVEDKINLDFLCLKDKYKDFFELIILNNSINYLNKEQIQKLKSSLRPGGKILANTFGYKKTGKINKNEMAIIHEDTVLHLLFNGDKCYEHKFFNRLPSFWEELEFNSNLYSNNSIKLEYVKNSVLYVNFLWRINMATRAIRRHHMFRKRDKAKRVLSNQSWFKKLDRFEKNKIICKCSENMAKCSCQGCGNPRKWFGRKTRQELFSVLKEGEQLDEI